MVPFNLLLLITCLAAGMDMYQILSAIHGFQGTYHFTGELLKSEFSTVLMGGLALWGLAQGREDRSPKLFFLGLLLFDAVFDVVEALQVDGKTPAQVAEFWKQLPAFKVYFFFQWPLFVACLILMTAGISFQMRKPFFLRYGPLEKWKSGVLLVFSVVYYLEATLLLLSGMGLV